MICHPKNYVSPNFHQMKQEAQHTGEAWEEKENGVKSGTHWVTLEAWAALLMSKMSHITCTQGDRSLWVAG